MKALIFLINIAPIKDAMYDTKGIRAIYSGSSFIASTKYNGMYIKLIFDNILLAK